MHILCLRLSRIYSIGGVFALALVWEQFTLTCHQGAIWTHEFIHLHSDGIQLHEGVDCLLPLSNCLLRRLTLLNTLLAQLGFRVRCLARDGL